MKDKKLKIRIEFLYVLFIGAIAFLIFQYRKIVATIIFGYYFDLNARMGKMLANTIVICICLLLCILVCWITAKCTDKFSQRQMDVGNSFFERHPQLNLIIALALVLIMGTMVWTIAYYVLLYLGHGINSLVNWLSDMASKMDAVVIVAFITGMVSIIGVIISSIVAKIIDYRKSRQDYLAKKRKVPYGEFVEMIYKIQQNVAIIRICLKIQMIDNVNLKEYNITKGV